MISETKNGQFKVSSGIQLARRNAELRAGFTLRKICNENGFYIAVNQSIELVFDLFFELVDLVFGDSDVVDVSIEDYYDCERKTDRKHYYVRSAERGIFLSVLQDFERTLLDDGNVGISIISPDETEFEIMLGPEKALIVYVYTGDMHAVRRIKTFLRAHGLEEDDNLKPIYEFASFANTSETLRVEFERLLSAVNAADDNDEGQDWDAS